MLTIMQSLNLPPMSAQAIPATKMPLEILVLGLAHSQERVLVAIVAIRFL